MVFDIENKVALITGGGSGIGLAFAKELLKNGAKGVVLAELDPKVGANAVNEIENQFGKNKAIFVETDITNKDQFDNAFKQTIQKFDHIDILINNAALLNDALWDREIETNLKGTIHGMILGFEHYLQKYKSGSEAVIINVSSVSGFEPLDFFPIYCATKFGILGLTLSWGLPWHHERTKVRVVALCPGGTRTALQTNARSRLLFEEYRTIPVNVEEMRKMLQTPEQVASGMVEVLRKADSGTAWIVEKGEAPYKLVLPDRFKNMEKIYLD